MDTNNEHHETDDTLDAQRDIIRQSLDAITNDIGMAMRDVGLTFPLYITVRNSGDALVTIATPLDRETLGEKRTAASKSRNRSSGKRSVGATIRLPNGDSHCFGPCST